MAGNGSDVRWTRPGAGIHGVVSVCPQWEEDTGTSVNDLLKLAA